MAKAVVLSMKTHVKRAEAPRRRKRAAERRELERTATETVVPLPPPPPRTGVSKKKIIEESRRWLSIINAHKLNDYKRRKIVSDTLENFRSYYNSGYLEYRKSVTEGGEFAAIEWSGKG
ncbi:MAG TPA: hypothetical protein VI589_09295, partial [Vicinamibacteria bacterium]